MPALAIQDDISSDELRRHARRESDGRVNINSGEYYIRPRPHAREVGQIAILPRAATRARSAELALINAVSNSDAHCTWTKLFILPINPKPLTLSMIEVVANGRGETGL